MQASTVEDEFLALVYADADWLRDEFEQLIAASWDDEPPAPGRPRSDPSPSGPRRRPVGRAPEVPTRSRRPDAFGRARSPPARLRG